MLSICLPGLLLHNIALVLLLLLHLLLLLLLLLLHSIAEGLQRIRLAVRGAMLPSSRRMKTAAKLRLRPQIPADAPCT